MSDLGPPDWKAHWIWHDADPGKPNTYVYLRRRFRVAAMPTGAVCHVSADTSYRLYLNGRFVGSGPVLSEPRWQSFDSYELAGFLRDGENVVGAIAYHFGNAIGNEEALTMGWSRGGFLCQIDLPESGGSSRSVVTDSSWDVLESPAWDSRSPKMDDMTFSEMYDASKEPLHWLQPEFSDTRWTPATVVAADESVRQWMRTPCSAKVLPWVQLEPRPIPHLIREELIPAAIVNSGEVLEVAEPNSIDEGRISVDIPIRMSLEPILPFKHTSIEQAESLVGAADGPAVMNPMDDNVSFDDFEGVFDPTITLDAGKLVNGRVFLDLEAAAGTLIDIGYGQVLVSGRVVPYLSRRTALADQYATRDGRQSFQTFGWRHFRYVQMTFRRMTEPISLHKVKIIADRYPAEQVGSFQCDDEMLNWIWQACVDTAGLCMHDRFMDTPFREKREYTGDPESILLATYAAFGHLDMIRKYFRDVIRGRTPQGVLPSGILGQRREPNRTYTNGGLFVLKVWQYYELFGNRQVVEDMFEPLLTFIRHLEEYTDDDGFLSHLPYPVYLDWADIELSGTSLCLNAVFAEALGKIADMAGVLGRQNISRQYREKHDKLSSLLPGLFWEEDRGVFIDSISEGEKSKHVSEHANYLIILFGFADPRQTKLALEFLREPSLEVGQVEPSFFWVTEGLYRANEGIFAVHMMKRRYERIRRQGLDTISEMWSMRGDRYPGRWRARDSRSAVMSCGVSPAYLLSRYVLGISPARPGFEQVRIAPQLCGLKWAQGTWPSSRGNIDVRWEKTRDGFRLECRLPDAMEGKVMLPEEILPAATLKVNGVEVDLKQAKKAGIPASGNLKVQVT